MDAQIALWLIQDGLTNGAVYALLGIATVLVFAVTRIIFVPQGEFVTFGALTLALLQTDKTPGSAWMVLWVALAAAALMLYRAWRQQGLATVPSSLLKLLTFPLATVLLVVWLAPRELALGWDIALTDKGPMILELNDVGGTEIAQVHGRGLLTLQTREFLKRHANASAHPWVKAL